MQEEQLVYGEIFPPGRVSAFYLVVYFHKQCYYFETSALLKHFKPALNVIQILG